MLTLPLLVATIALGVAVGRWWTLTLPIVPVAALAVVFAMSGSLWDSPVVFLLLLAELGTALGVFLRQRLEAGQSSVAS